MKTFPFFPPFVFSDLLFASYDHENPSKRVSTIHRTRTAAAVIYIYSYKSRWTYVHIRTDKRPNRRTTLTVRYSSCANILPLLITNLHSCFGTCVRTKGEEASDRQTHGLTKDWQKAGTCKAKMPNPHELFGCMLDDVQTERIYPLHMRKQIHTNRQTDIQTDWRMDKDVHRQATSSGLKERQMLQKYFMFPYVVLELRIVNRE